MREFRADMHTHSTFSDGSLTPKELLLFAKEKGLQGLSITDHDTIGAYPEAFAVADEVGIALVAGVEFSSYFEGVSVHILGYGFDFRKGSIAALCARHTQRRTVRNRAMIAKLQQLQFAIEESEIVGHQVGRPHMAHVLVQKGYVKDVQEAFLRYLGEGKIAFVQGETIPPQETIDAIHAEGGIAVLAHPHLLPKRKLWLKKLLKHPFDGIECYYARLCLNQETKWIELAQERGWWILGGSDFHGECKPQNMLGSSWIDEVTFRMLLKKSGNFQRR